MPPRIHYWPSCIGLVHGHTAQRNAMRIVGGVRRDNRVCGRFCVYNRGKLKDSPEDFCSQSNRSPEQMVQLSQTKNINFQDGRHNDQGKYE